MIVSASRRTDIPAFYMRWFMNRVRAGACLVANPFNPRQRRLVSLRPEDVEALIFWSKDARPLLPELDELERRGLRSLVLFTINYYGAMLEPRVPALEVRLETFRALADRLGPSRVIWRYDPILLSPATPAGFHLRAFESIARALEHRTGRVVVSLVDLYRKTQRRLRGQEVWAWRGDEPQALELLGALAQVAAARGMRIQSCAEEHDWTALGIPPGACVDRELLASLWPVDATARKDPGQRPACLCSLSRDIGAVDTCLHGCRYCYATRDDAIAQRRHAAHDPESPSLWSAGG